MPEAVARATQEYLDTLDDAAFGATEPVEPKALSPTDPAARYIGANGDRPSLLIRQTTSSIAAMPSSSMWMRPLSQT